MAQVNLGHVVGPGVPTGGTAGQVLKKNGSTNFDASWATLNSGNIPISASDNTTVQQSLAAVKSDIGIVEDGNTATHTIAAGQYVIWKGALYTASAAIPSGTTLSSSNLTAVSDGGLNALNGNIGQKCNVIEFQKTSIPIGQKSSWDEVYSEIANGYIGAIIIHFKNGSNIMGMVYKNNVSYGSILGTTDDDGNPYFYGVKNGTSALRRISFAN